MTTLDTGMVTWLTTSQAARRLDVSANWIRQLAATGKLRTVTTAHGILVDPSSVDELARTRCQGTGSPAGGRQH